MCGIAGFSGAFSAELLTAMTQAVAHRGPDGFGHRLLDGPSGRVGLGHRRLSIIDLSPDGAQPMTVECDRCGVNHARATPAEATWLTFNGEIYNFPALRSELLAKGHSFHSRTDSEVLLHLYAEHGTDMLTRLNGIFAFGIYDGRRRGQIGGLRPGDLLLARDGLGVKPLYYAPTPEGLLFGSEIKSLLQSSSVTRELDEVALDHHLAYLWSPAPRTLLKNVRKIEPGAAMIVRGGGIVREWTHYDIPYGREPFDANEADLAHELRERLQEAVDRQMISDVPVGAFLSGGLDSSAVVAMIRKARPDYRPRCFSIGFAGEEAEEGAPADLPYARRVADHLGVDLCEIIVEPSAIDNLERMLWHLDEPQADPAPINALLIAERARAEGIPVLLSGAGGDDIFSGYRRHHALRLERMWGWLPHFARAALAAPARWLSWEGALPSVMKWHPMRRLARAFVYADVSADERLISYFWWAGEEMRKQLYGRDLANRLEGVDAAEPLINSLKRIPRERDPLNRMLYLEARHFLADHNLNYTDKMGMASGIEVRVPLLDPDLVDFATRVPTSMKQRGSIGKAIFKRAMEPDLPHDVIYRPKTGFGAPLRRWLKMELRDRVEDTLSASTLRHRGLFDPVGVRRLIEQDRQGRVDGGYTIFALMCIELWCRMFVDAPGVPKRIVRDESESALLAGIGRVAR